MNQIKQIKTTFASHMLQLGKKCRYASTDNSTINYLGKKNAFLDLASKLH